jgi:hypothetical protein
VHVNSQIYLPTDSTLIFPSNNRALTSLDISNQVWYEDWDEEKKYPQGGIGVEGAKALAEALR